jgi:hypothetical protein
MGTGISDFFLFLRDSGMNPFTQFLARASLDRVAHFVEI